MKLKIANKINIYERTHKKRHSRSWGAIVVPGVKGYNLLTSIIPEELLDLESLLTLLNTSPAVTKSIYKKGALYASGRLNCQEIK